MLISQAALANVGRSYDTDYTYNMTGAQLDLVLVTGAVRHHGLSTSTLEL